MNSETSNLRIVVYGVLVGLGMVVVALAVFARLPVGKEFMCALRKDGTDQSDARVETVQDDQTAAGTESADSDHYRPSNSDHQQTRDLADEGFPRQITITRNTEVTIGMSRLTFEVGETLTVSGRKGGLFLCDYLGDTVEVPIDVTDWADSGQTTP